MQSSADGGRRDYNCFYVSEGRAVFPQSWTAVHYVYWEDTGIEVPDFRIAECDPDGKTRLEAG
jgi:hypothetical protein